MRTTGAVVLVLLGCLLAPLSVVSVWANSQVTDTNRYVETVAPLANDPAVQAAVTDDVTNRIFSYVDVAALTTDAVNRLAAAGALPPAVVTPLKGLAQPLADGVKGFVHDEVAKIVSSDAFSAAWVRANRVAHQEVVGALTGQGAKAVAVRNGTVTVNLGPVVEQVKARLVARGFSLADKIPKINATFVAYQSPDITKVQNGLRLLNTLGTWLPVIVLVLLGAGVYVARSHRLALVGTGLGVAAAMLVMAVVLVVVRARYLDAVPADKLPPDAAASMFDTLVRFLRESLRAVLVLGLVVGLGAFFTGPSVTAVTTRSALVKVTALARRGVEALGLHLERVTRWVAPRATVLRVVCTLVAVAVLVIGRVTTYPTAGFVLWVTAGLLLGLFVVQLLATSAAGPAPPRQRQPA